MVFYILYSLIYLPVLLLWPTKILHKEKMPKKKTKCIVTSNHYTNVDPFLYNVRFNRKFIFMAKKEIFKNKFSAFIFSRVGAFPVDRDNVTPAVYKRTLSELNQNHQVFIFPEGTRNKEGTEELGSVKTGIITFASKGETEIIPMLLHHAPKMFRKNYIIVGDPVKIVGENPKRLTKEEVEINVKNYTAAMDALRVEVDEFVNSKKKKKKAK